MKMYIHLCGDGSAVNLVTRVCTDFLGDDVEIRQYERLSPLVAMRGGLSQGIQKGDCVVAFSRQRIHAIKQQIERQTGFRCCVIYGSLPPEARSTQAALFNDTNSGYDVLVASDAIGMGLNLNIKRVIFSSVLKFDGTEERHPFYNRNLTVSEIKQIAGRAGRFGSIYPEGRVTCINARDSGYMIENLKAPIPELKQAGLAPTFEQLEMFYLSDESKPALSVLLDRFALYANVDNVFFLYIRELAVLLEPLNMGLKDLYTFCLSPADANKPLVKHSLYQYAAMYAAKDIKSVPLRIEAGPDEPIYHGMPHLLDTIDEREKLKRLEELYNVADNYAWLSYRLPKFDERDKAFVVKNQVHALISALLDSMSEAQGEASWSRVERMRREAMIQKDAQAMRNLERESRRSARRKVLAPAESDPGGFEVSENALNAPTHTQAAFARAQVQAQALAQPHDDARSESTVRVAARSPANTIENVQKLFKKVVQTQPPHQHQHQHQHTQEHPSQPMRQPPRKWNSSTPQHRPSTQQYNPSSTVSITQQNFKKNKQTPPERRYQRRPTPHRQRKDGE